MNYPEALSFFYSFSDWERVVGFNKAATGFESFDDCAIYDISEKQLIIQSLDFFTPIVDDPYIFGQIAATNSL